MTLILLALCTLIVGAQISLWCAIEIRDRRWHLYALRDELRMLAIKDGAVAASELFWETDYSLTRLCDTVDEISLVQFANLFSKNAKYAPAAPTPDKTPGLEQIQSIHIRAVRSVFETVMLRHSGPILLLVGPLFHMHRKSKDALSRPGVLFGLTGRPPPRPTPGLRLVSGM